MNYSESMNKRRDEARKRFRRMMAVMLFLGIVIGFLIGRVTAYADTAYKPTEGPEITVEPDTLSTDLPAVIAPSTAPQEPETTPEPEPVLLGTYRITAYCSCEICPESSCLSSSAFSFLVFCSYCLSSFCACAARNFV